MAYTEKQRTYMRDYMRAYQQRPEVKAQQAAVRGVIKGIAHSFGCAVCGKDTGRLHFHHIDPSMKRRQVSNMEKYSWAAIFAEIDKCEVLCPKHHKERHQEMRS